MNSAGAPEITDTNNYYPFGLNHTGGNGLNSSNFGSFYSYKYNGKELQETGMFDYGWRQYMPDLGRWNGIDQLAEAYTSISPFAYVANNPISMRDPDGRWMDAAGHIDTSGYANPFTIMSHSQMLMTQFMAENPRDGGGGAYTFNDKDARAIFNYLANKENFSEVNITDGKVMWFTGNAMQTSYRMGNDYYGDINLGVIHSANFKTSSVFDLSLLGNLNDGVGGFGEGLSYNARNGARLYVGTARPGIPVDLGFTKFYGNGKTYIKPAYMGKVGSVLGKASIAGTVILGGINIYNGVQKDGGTFGHNATIATGGTIGGAAGAYGGAILGAEIGAGIGVWFGGVGAAPGAFIGGLIGGVVGGIAGTKAGEIVVN
ncbi:hypothetical protein LF887_07050 [Chryseobacterium sp. MEBOG06]|uniref:RHS repeat-associated core domain-containing protein n=1 Tax=Chryseobacterium sp. MEBOG06 TaxID=2879938 RepID=UPI001F296D95|nr:RHS repeat-associated core domain-containing protein [Chryseobacterium sp. MEBOG06]UKB85376.1 hypothetical protein LF887_07050 [Chryseobacterium sp. MEBOG06]